MFSSGMYVQQMDSVQYMGWKDCIAAGRMEIKTKLDNSGARRVLQWYNLFLV